MIGAPFFRHWKVGEGAPAAPTEKVVEPPATTLRAAGWAVMMGAVGAVTTINCASELFASSDLLGPIGPRALWREIRTADDGGVVADLTVWSYEGLLGRVVTWVALLFGASFWYDALRRLIGLKGKVVTAEGGG